MTAPTMIGWAGRGSLGSKSSGARRFLPAEVLLANSAEGCKCDCNGVCGACGGVKTCFIVISGTALGGGVGAGGVNVLCSKGSAGTDGATEAVDIDGNGATTGASPGGDWALSLGGAAVEDEDAPESLALSSFFCSVAFFFVRDSIVRWSFLLSFNILSETVISI